MKTTSSVPGASFYDDHYRRFGEQAVEWFRAGAIEKVRSLENVLQGRVVTDILEIGCGTGAILEEMHRRRLGKRYWAVDCSVEAVAHVKRMPIPFERVEVADGTNVAATFGRSFDLIVLSHILEHVQAPEALLTSALAAARYVFVEVPLESSIGLNLKWAALSALGRQRTDNLTGHIHFFSKRSFHAVLQRCSARVVSSRTYIPLDATVLALNDTSRAKRSLMRALHRALGTEMYRRLWYAHHACLLEFIQRTGT